jgi:hypothetical protein
MEEWDLMMKKINKLNRCKRTMILSRFTAGVKVVEIDSWDIEPKDLVLCSIPRKLFFLPL